MEEKKRFRIKSGSFKKECPEYKENDPSLKIYEVIFDGVYPVGSCLILAAKDINQASEMAKETIKHTSKFVIVELPIDEPKVITYLSGDY